MSIVSAGDMLAGTIELKEISEMNMGLEHLRQLNERFTASIAMNGKVERAELRKLCICPSRQLSTAEED